MYDPISIFSEIRPILNKYDVPDPIVASLIQIESTFNPDAENGSAYGLFQLLYPGGEGTAALADGYTISSLFIPYVNAKYAMPSIASAWDTLKDTFQPDSLDWWLSFCALSGHPALNGNTADPAVQAFAPKMKDMYTYFEVHPIT